MSRELRTVTTAASARPHFDFTMSIFPADGKTARAIITASGLLHVPTLTFSQIIRSFGLFLIKHTTF